MSRKTDPRREAILESAFTQFSHYGFRKTSMEDIAKATGISRASLYSHFENKEEIFRSLAASLHEQTLAEAESHLKSRASQAGRSVDLATRVETALLIRLGRFHQVVTQSAHGSEISDENNQLCGDLVRDSQERFRGILKNAMKAAVRADEIDLKSAGLTPATAAELLHLGAAGLKKGAADLATLEKRLNRFIRIFFAGLR
jgi:AcrR family transcriptional regulator